MQRYTAKEALNHPWITRRKEHEIPKTLFDKISSLNQEQKFRTAINFCISTAVLMDRKPDKQYRRKCEVFSQKIDKWKQKVLQSNKGSFLFDQDFVSNIQSPCKFGSRSASEASESEEAKTPKHSEQISTKESSVLKVN